MTTQNTMVGPSIQDELINKLKILYSALDQAKNIITKLDNENRRLSDLLQNVSIHQEKV